MISTGGEPLHGEDNVSLERNTEEASPRSVYFWLIRLVHSHLRLRVYLQGELSFGGGVLISAHITHITEKSIPSPAKERRTK